MNYLVHSDEDRKRILNELNIKEVTELFKSIPQNIIYPDLNLDEDIGEKEIIERITEISKKNVPISNFKSFIGGGAYNHYIPATVESIQSISQFYTAYTPYQAEISQGTLQYNFEFQSLICRLTGMDVSNASMYDAASATAEAILMAKRINGKKKVLISDTVHPDYRMTVKTYCKYADIELLEINSIEGSTDLDNLNNSINSILNDVAAVVIQNPNFFGCFEDVFKIKEILSKSSDCLLIMVVNPLTLSLLKPPSEYGADIVVGDAQGFGCSLNFGGPYVGFFSTKKEYLRQMPGRIVGRTIDSKGNSAYVLTFQAREQHIRKYKATSNICSNHSLNALAVTVYLATLGEKGLKENASLCLQKAHYLSERIIKECTNIKLKFNKMFFNEFVLECKKIDSLISKLYEKNIILGLPLKKYYSSLDDCILVTATEMNSYSDIDFLIEAIKSS